MSSRKSKDLDFISLSAKMCGQVNYSFMEKVDFVIIGGGMAGMSAAVYAVRFGMKVVLISPEFGGLIATTHMVENYPGFSAIPGAELGENFRKHCEYLKVPMVQKKVERIEKIDGEILNYKTVCDDGTEYESPTVLVATGSAHRRLGVKGENEFFGKGVSYCATCDGMFFAGRDVIVVGGSDSAANQALYLAEIANKVTIVYRGKKIRAEEINRKRVEENPKIEVITEANVTEIIGDETGVTGAKLDTGAELKTDGVFIEIGYVPRNGLVKDLGVELSPIGEIVVDRHGATNVPGIYAAGDAVAEPFKQAITAAAMGVHASNQAYSYVKNLKK